MKKDIVTISGEIHQKYEYSTGIAGARFFKELRDNARIFGTKCTLCDRIMVPPRIFCEKCFNKVDDWVVLPSTGTIHCFTVSYLGINAERLTEPEIFAIIDIDGADGGLYHILGEVDNTEKLHIGMRVQAVFKGKKEREGSILDIKYFKPIEL